ncbi:hypothetical protein POTOM_060476 [Populus tomentosa]|uniref:Alpha-carbonic anhydrase domain-containing protein n=1 Tax=Populus tomentosa TaxID=118781 RepID=A0A8X7XRG3_POPTO|nr:hypothetical protein POTOM_060476 [Populus tomentosa]
MNGASMEEVWDDINLASLHDHSNTNTSSNTNRHSFNGYTVELEREAAHLAQENAKLRRQQERFLAAAPAQLPKKKTLYRTSTAPF